MELVLVDEEVRHFTYASDIGITASIGQKDMNKFAKLLVEGRSYMIKKIQVSSTLFPIKINLLHIMDCC